MNGPTPSARLRAAFSKLVRDVLVLVLARELRAALPYLLPVLFALFGGDGAPVPVPDIVLIEAHTEVCELPPLPMV